MLRFTSCLALTAAVLTFPRNAPAQETVAPADTTGTGLIVGQVVDATSNKPLNGVVVRPFRWPTLEVSADPSVPSSVQVMTGADGRFVFRDLPKGSFRSLHQRRVSRRRVRPAAAGLAVWFRR